MKAAHIIRFVGVSMVSFLCFVSSFAFSQTQPNFFSKTKQDGLQSNTVYYIHSAKNGLLYVAHSKGLSSFDGFAFKNFYNKSFPYTEVSNIMESTDGTIFCKAFNNSIYRLGKDDSLVNEKWMPTQTGFSPSAIYQNIIIGIQHDSVAFYNTASKATTLVATKDMKETSDYKDIIFCAYAKVDSGYGFVLVDKRWNCFKSNIQKAIHGQLHFSNGQVFLVRQQESKGIFDLMGNSIISVKTLSPNTFINYVTFFNNYIWICTTNGLYYLSELDKTATIRKILDGYNVSNIAKTTDDTYVISTLGNGLICIPNFNVLKLANLPSKLSKLSGSSNELYIGTELGSTLTYNTSTNQLEQQHDGVDQKKTGLLVYDTITNTLISSGLITTIRNKNVSFKLPAVLKDYTYTPYGLVLATNAGIYFWGQENNACWWLNNEDKSKKFPTLLKHLLYFDEPVFSVAYHPEQDKFYFNSYRGNFELSKNDSLPVAMPEPYCVLSDLKYYDHKLLLITKDQGILEWDGKQYKQAYANSPKAVFYKAEIYENKLWLIAEEALYCYDGQQWKTFDNRYGIEADNINGLFVHRNNVYINTGESIIYFPLDLGSTQSKKPKFLLQRASTPLGQIQTNSTLSSQFNSILIDYHILNYSNGENTHLAYSINDEALIHMDNSARQIQLNHLTPGKYNIKFFVVQDNKPNEKPDEEFSFSIEPPFYKTWWFISILFLAATGTIIFISRNILYRWKKESRLKQSKLLLEKELDKSILSSIKAQMNPHFLFNALNTIQSYIYMNDKYNASLYISKFSDLTRSILDSSNKENITLDEEIHALSLYLDLEKMRFEDSFTHEIIVDKSINKELLTIPSMLIQPYVENAIKHGLLHKKTDRILIVKFEIENNKLKVTIDDNGIGRKRSQELNAIRQRKHQSFAMDANKKRLEILKHNFKDISFEIIDKYSSMDEPIGTKVIITLPIQTASQS
jgi:two-component sensor histidine kinase